MLAIITSALNSANRHGTLFEYCGQLGLWCRITLPALLILTTAIGEKRTSTVARTLVMPKRYPTRRGELYRVSSAVKSTFCNNLFYDLVGLLWLLWPILLL